MMQDYHHKPRKRFGQHFLTDDAILSAMRRAVSPRANDHLVEIGPGLGVLTRQLIEGVRRYDAIEIDRDLIPVLQKTFGEYPQLMLHEMDVLQMDWSTLVSNDHLRVIGNLPYNISTPLLFHLFSALPLIQDMHFLLQKEVGERLAAPVSDHHFGRLSVMAQYYCDVELLFDVAPSAFTPPPKVDSVFLRLTPRPEADRCCHDIKMLERILSAAFNQRRKTVRNSLSGVVSVEQLELAGIDPKKRAQDISVDQYVGLVNLSL